LQVNPAIPILNWISFILTNGVMVLLLILALRYKLSRTLKSLVIYVVFACVQSIWIECLGAVPHSYQDPGFYYYFYTYWILGFTLSILRLYIILEICKLVLQDYTAVKTFAWRILAGMSVIMFSWTVYFAIRNAHHLRRLLLTFQATTDLSFAVLLLTLMGFGVYYKMRILELYRYVLIGSCIYSAEQVVGSEVLRVTPNVTNSVFDFVQRFTWFLMMAIWAWAVWRWAGRPAKSPEMVPQTAYDDLSPRVHDHLRDLNNKLAALAQS
jgi:hypothetical protein